MYLLAFILPPLAVLMCGKPIQAILNIVLTLCMYFPGAIHAILVVNDHKRTKDTDKIIAALNGKKKNKALPSSSVAILIIGAAVVLCVLFFGIAFSMVVWG